MKLHRKFAFAIAVLALAVTLASTASAQWVTKNASFTLPFTANWEGKVLPPGDYTVSVYKLGGGIDVNYRVEFAGEGKKGTILAVNRPGPRAAAKSMLVADCSRSTCNIRALHLSKADLVLTFIAPKPERTKVAEARELTPTVPFEIALK